MNGNKLGVLAQILIHHFLQMGVFSFFAGKAKLKGGKILGKGNGRNGLEGALKGVAAVFLSRIERYNRGGKRQKAFLLQDGIHNAFSGKGKGRLAGVGIAVFEELCHFVFVEGSGNAQPRRNVSCHGILHGNSRQAAARNFFKRRVQASVSGV